METSHVKTIIGGARFAENTRSTVAGTWPTPRNPTGFLLVKMAVVKMAAILSLLASAAPAAEVPLTNFVTIEGSYTNPRITSADLDGDGDLDVLASSSGDDEVTWWENVAGDGSS